VTEATGASTHQFYDSRQSANAARAASSASVSGAMMILFAAVKTHFCGAPARTKSLISSDNGTHLSREAQLAC